MVHMQEMAFEVCGSIAATSDVSALKKQLLSLPHNAMLRIKGPTYSDQIRQMWQDVIYHIGNIRDEKNYESLQNGAAAPQGKHKWIWTDIINDPDYPNTFRHSTTAQPLHTDGAYMAEHSEFVFFLGEKSCTKGGETLFISAETLHEELEQNAPELLTNIINTPVRHAKDGYEATNRCILSNDSNGYLLNWSYVNARPEEASSATTIKEAFHKFLAKHIIAKNKCTPFKLSSGEVLIWRDRRFLHGRNAFEASTRGERIIWKLDFGIHAK